MTPPPALRGSKGGRRLDAALARSPLQPLFRWRAGRRLAVLAYHKVADLDRFADHLDHIASAMHPVSMNEVAQAVTGVRGLPRRAVLLTFDDGDPTLLQAASLLRDRGLPAVAFVVSSVVGTVTPFWWDEVMALFADGLAAQAQIRRLKQVPDAERRKLLAALRRQTTSRIEAEQLAPQDLRQLESYGVEVGNHTASHPILPRCRASVVRREVVTAHEQLAGHLGHAPRAFAYPNGDHDLRAESLLEELGYDAAFLFDHRLGQPSRRSRFRLSRLRVNDDTPADRFRIIVSGLHPALHRALGRR